MLCADYIFPYWPGLLQIIGFMWCLLGFGSHLIHLIKFLEPATSVMDDSEIREALDKAKARKMRISPESSPALDISRAPTLPYECA